MCKLNQFSGFVFLISQLSILVVHSQNIVLFEGFLHKGKQAVLFNVSSCTNLPKDMEKKVTAIDTKGNCIRFYAEHNCTGKFIEVLPRSPSHHFLGDWGFNDMTVSVGPCSDQCSVNVTGPVPSKENGINITVYDRINYQGAMETINVKGCTLIPRKINYRIASVNTTSDEGHCFQLYNNIDCIGRNWAKGQDSIELRQGSPFHNDLRRWLFPIAKAISHCSYKCDKAKLSPEKSQPQLQPSIESPLVLYDEVNFRGNGLPIQMPNSGIDICLNLDQFDGWEGAAASLKFYLNQTNCLMVFEAKNCTGHLQLRVTSSVTNLTSNKFMGMTRSLKFCDPNSIPESQQQSGEKASTKSVSRFGIIMLLVAGFITGIVFLMAIVSKWYYPNMSLRNAVLGRFGNEMGFSGPNVLRL